jgi:divalent metal cation (Fe/Co/Zn/Cd) transporter
MGKAQFFWAFVVALVLFFEPDTTVAELEAVVDRIEARIREVVPGARCDIEAESLKAPLHGEVAGPS